LTLAEDGWFNVAAAASGIPSFISRCTLSLVSFITDAFLMSKRDSNISGHDDEEKGRKECREVAGDQLINKQTGIGTKRGNGKIVT